MDASFNEEQPLSRKEREVFNLINEAKQKGHVKIKRKSNKNRLIRNILVYFLIKHF